MIVDKVKSWLSSIKIKHKLLALFLIVAIIPIIISATVSYKFVAVNMKQQLLANIDGDINKISYIVNEKISIYEDLIADIAYNTDLNILLNTRTTENEEALQRFVENIISTSLEKKSEFINIQIRYDGEKSSEIEQICTKDKNLKSTVWRIGEKRIIIYKNVLDIYTYKNIGNILITLDAEKFFGEYYALSYEGYGLYVSDERNQETFSIWNSKEDTVRPKLNNILNAEDNIVKFLNKKYVVMESNALDNSWKVSSLVNYDVISSRINPLIQMMIMIFLGCIVFAVVVSFVSSGYLSKRINNLLASIQNLDTDSEFNEENITDEIGKLSAGIKYIMLERENLQADMYLSEIKLKESQFKALQSQINPHFLYNTLDKINWCAILSDNMEISDMAKWLSNFYRTALNKGDIITSIKNEIVNVESYIQLQQVMHGNSFQVEYDLDEAYFEYEIVNLVLQPIVENALEHGIDKSIGNSNLR